MDLPSISEPQASMWTTDLISVPSPTPPAVTESEARLKFIDDLSLAECVTLDCQLCPGPSLIGPRLFHDRNGLILPPHNSLLQKRLEEINIAAKNHEMKLNLKKNQSDAL